MRVVVCAASVTATAIGCGWMGTSHSVRFNAYQSEREMGRLPPLPTMANGLNEVRANWGADDGGDNEDAYTIAEKRSKDLGDLWDRAATAEKDGNLRLAKDLLNDYLKRTEITREIWSSADAVQSRRNSAIDRLDALNALNRGAQESRVKAYLDARRP